jgi:hypothetical protein
MSEDAQKLWNWSGLRVEEYVAAVNPPNLYYLGRCKVIVPPFIIHEVVLLKPHTACVQHFRGHPNRPASSRLQ